MLELESDIQVVGEADDAEWALQELDTLDTDVVLALGKPWTAMHHHSLIQRGSL